MPGVLYPYGRHQPRQLPGLGFREALVQTTRDRADVRISVGVSEDGRSSWKVCSENGREPDAGLYRYEIGSTGKTFNAALVQRAVRDGKLGLDQTIDRYLELLAHRCYPTMAELLTHTSGYKGCCFESPMIVSFLGGRNVFCGISSELVPDRLGRLKLQREDHAFNYSNFGYAVPGLVLEAVHGCDNTDLLRDFVHHDLGLTDTEPSPKDSGLEHARDWRALSASTRRICFPAPRYSWTGTNCLQPVMGACRKWTLFVKIMSCWAFAWMKLAWSGFTISNTV